MDENGSNVSDARRGIILASTIPFRNGFDNLTYSNELFASANPTEKHQLQQTHAFTMPASA